MDNRVSRRGFIGAAALGMGAVGFGAAASAHADETASVAFEKTVAWDAEYDVVVIGCGLAGETAAIEAAEAGASVLIIEKADVDHAGGNSRYAMQVAVDFDHTKTDLVLEYFKKVRGKYATPSDSILEAFVNGTMENIEWAAKHGANLETVFSAVGEFQELEGWDLMNYVSVDATYWNGALFQALLKDIQDNYSDSIDIWYEAPAVALIQDAQTKIVHGVTVEVEQATYNVRAKNGVVMCAGGFEANIQMVQDYIQLPYGYPKGSTYNTGDGIKLSMSVGADLWHMGNASGPDLNYINPETGRSTYFAFAGYQAVPGHSEGFCSANSAIIVGADGTRFHDEGVMPGHGFVNFHGMLLRMPVSLPAYCVFDEPGFSHAIYPMWDNNEQLENGTIVKADTLADLTATLGLPEGSLDATVAKYNGFCVAGEDADYGRSPEYLVALAETGPYYAFEVKPAFTNTMGGPQRDAQGYVLDTQGNQIPHFFSAGECGSVWGDVYQGGANIGECLVFGRISGRAAAAEKDDSLRESVLDGEAVDFAAVATGPEIAAADGELVGTGTGIGGDVVVKVVMDGDAIASIEVVSQNETPGIGSVAIEQLPAKIVEANSTDIDVIAGATTTSHAIFDAVNAAIASK